MLLSLVFCLPAACLSPARVRIGLRGRRAGKNTWMLRKRTRSNSLNFATFLVWAEQQQREPCVFLWIVAIMVQRENSRWEEWYPHTPCPTVLADWLLVSPALFPSTDPEVLYILSITVDYHNIWQLKWSELLRHLPSRIHSNHCLLFSIICNILFKMYSSIYSRKCDLCFLCSENIPFNFWFRHY